MRKKTKKIVGIVSISVVGVLIAVIVAFIIYLVACNASGKVPYVGNNAILRVTTQSMGNTIPPGTYILVENIDPDEIKVGDVIVFSSRDPAILGMLNTHRVVEISETDGQRTFTTKGDNPVTNPNPDAYKVFADDVRGRYVENLDTLTALASVVLSPFGLVLLIFIPASIMIVFSIVDIVKKSKELKEENDGEKLTDEEKIAREVERLRREGYNQENDDNDKREN